MDEPERMAFIIRSTMTAVFDIANSEHIDEERAKLNLYWDCYNGFRNFKNPDKENELSATFEDVEQLFLSSAVS